MKLRRLATVMVAASMMATASSAYAATPHTSAREHSSARTASIQKAAGLNLGLSNGSTTALTSGSNSSEQTWTKRAKSEGIQLIRVAVDWQAIAPTDPTDPTDPSSTGYNWTALDQMVTKLVSEGFTPEMVVDDAPSWAEGANMPWWAAPGSWRPNDTDLQQFAEALATRYNGKFTNPAKTSTKLPKVTYWEAWNEPNLSTFLSPQTSNENGKCTSKSVGSAQSPAIFRGLQNAFYAGVKSVSSSDVVLMAGLAPYANPDCKWVINAATYRVSPLPFLRDALCLNAKNQHVKGCNKVTDFNALNSHPYPPPDSHVGMLWHAPSGDTAVADVGKLKSILTAAERAKTVYPTKNINFWVTEIGWDTNSPDKGGVNQTTAANWVNQGFFLLWQQGVRDILWFRLNDISHFKGASWPGGSGLFYSNGKAKPMATAFKFPFVTHRVGRNTVRAWGRTPVAGTLRIQRQDGRSWITVASGHVGQHEVFLSTISQYGAGNFRAVVGNQTSLTWNQGNGTW